MADITSVLPVSKNRDTNSSTNPFVIQISDGTDTATVDASGNLNVILASNSGTTVGDVRITDGTDILDVVADGDALGTQKGVLIFGSDGTNLQVLATATDGALHIDDGGNSITVDDGGTTLSVDGTVTADQGTAAAVGGAWPILVTDGTDTAAVTAAGELQIDIAAQSLTAVKVSKDANANSESNPIFVQNVTGAVSGTEIHDYDTATVTSAGTSDHDYTASGGVFLLRAFHASSSGAMKVEVLTGSGAGPTAMATYFTSMANPNLEIEYNPPKEVADTEVVRLTRTNRENSSMDVYSTIVGAQL